MNHRLLTGLVEFVHACKEVEIQPILGGDNSGQRLGHLKDVFNDRIYLILQDPSVGLPLSSISRRMKAPMVVTHPVHYLTPDQAQLQCTQTAIRLNKPIEPLLSEWLAAL